MTKREASASPEWHQRSPRVRAAALAALLTVPAAVIATQLYAGYRLEGIPVRFGAAFVLQLVHWEWWAIFGPLVWRLERRWPLSEPGRYRSIVRHAAAAPLVAAVVLSLNLTVYHVLVRVPMLAGWFTGMRQDIRSTVTLFFTSFFHVELLIYGGIVAAAYASRTTALLRSREQEALRLEAELTGAKLTALRSQLQPHFLFNTLHTIGSLVLQRQTEQAVQLLAELGELLRGTLAHRDTDLAPLREEVEYLRRYLKIEEARFGDRLRVEWAIDPATLDALIPPFILQPLIENAFKHGISKRTDESLLGVAAVIIDDSLRITIYNDGPPLGEPFSSEAGSGFGLENVRARLRTRSPSGGVELANADAGVCVTLVLPLWAATTVRSTR